jgi:signal transduction histidine kinase/HAMP domain-containing protein
MPTRMRLRGKLVVALVTAALVPIFLVSAIAVSVIVSSLDRGLAHDAQQQVRVAKNLVARSVEGLGEPASALAKSAELARALDEGPQAVRDWAERQLPGHGPLRLQVLGATAGLLADQALGGAEPDSADATASAALVADALAARIEAPEGDPGAATGVARERTRWLVPALEVSGPHLVARAIAAVPGSAGRPRAFVVLTLPIDGALADTLRSELGSDVVVSGPNGRLVTTLRDEGGQRRTDLRLEARALERVMGGEAVVGPQRFGNERYQVAVEGLVGRDGTRVGALAIALERRVAAATERWAIRSLAIGGLLALGVAIGFAAWWSRRLVTPLARLHRGATAVARGQLDYRLDEPDGDEIGDLASAFNSMTRTLKENQVRLAARMREIVALHDAGRAVSSAIDLDSVARKIVEALARTFDVELVALWLANKEGSLSLGAARARRRDVSSALALDDALAAAARWQQLAGEAMARREPMRVMVEEGGQGEWTEAGWSTNPGGKVGGASASTASKPEASAQAPTDGSGSGLSATLAASAMSGAAIPGWGSVSGSWSMPGSPAVASPTPPPAASLSSSPSSTAPVTPSGSVLAVPLVRKARVVGVLVATRPPKGRLFSEAELNLLRTFADQAGTAVENALLYDEVRGASEELERKVKLRTGELLAINTELGRTVADLRETQAQLVLSERLAGLGMLVAGVAHEINSPAAAIHGSIDALTDVLARSSRQVEAITAAAPRRAPFIFAFLDQTAQRLAARRPPTGPAVRQLARELAGPLAELAAGAAAGGDPPTAADTRAAVLHTRGAPSESRPPLETRPVPEVTAIAAPLAELGASAEDASALLHAVADERAALIPAIAALGDHVFLQRTAATINSAVSRIARIVGALKAYSHLDQQATRVPVDLREGIESTLTLLDHSLRDIVVECKFGPVPPVPIYVDELNQVWTNLIQNAAQAMSGKGQLVIETSVEDGRAVVRVIDDGPGIPEQLMSSIFEPFFTTKPKGQGSGLGLGISRQIVIKHEGEMWCQSRPGHTCFEVRLPLDAPRPETAS